MANKNCEFTVFEIQCLNMEEECIKAITKTSEQGVDFAKSITPVSEGDGGPLGHTRDNITYDIDKTKLTSRIHFGEKWMVGNYVEYGTAKQAPRPVMRKTAPKTSEYMKTNISKMELDFTSK